MDRDVGTKKQFKKMKNHHSYGKTIPLMGCLEKKRGNKLVFSTIQCPL